MSIEKEPLFSPKNLKLLTEPLGRSNPITVQVLGICSALAVTVKLKPSIVLALSVVVVMAVSNVAISLLRKMVPPRIRIIVQLVVIATMVILVDQVLKAYAYDISKQLSVFVGLIITNCIIMGRAEAFAQSNPPVMALWDGITSGAGYMAVLLIIAAFREILGAGSLMGYQILGEGFTTWTIMVMPPSAFFLLGSLIWAARTIMIKKEAS